jgi:hypothetical protein
MRRLAHAGERDLPAVAVRDSGKGLEDLRQRPEGDARAVGKAPSVTARPRDPPSAVLTNSRVSRLLPTPASPKIVTRLALDSSAERVRTLASRSSSRSRPTRGAWSPGTPRSGRSEAIPSSTMASTLVARPRTCALTGSENRKPRVDRAVRVDTRTVPGSALVCSRAATFIASPVTIGSPGAGSISARTSPVLTPARICRRTPCSCSSESLTRSRAASMARAARSARSGSSSCVTGTPNRATTASPMNFSTVPPSDSMAARIASKYVRITVRIRSGSRRSARPVEPATSANSTVTTRRSPSLGGGERCHASVVGAVDDAGVPHDEQKAASGPRSAPQAWQVPWVGAPHDGQKRAVASCSDLQDLQMATAEV